MSEVPLVANRERKAGRVGKARRVADEVEPCLAFDGALLCDEILDSPSEVQPSTRFGVGIILAFQQLPDEIETGTGSCERVQLAPLPVVHAVEEEPDLPEVILGPVFEPRARPAKHSANTCPRCDVVLAEEVIRERLFKCLIGEKDADVSTKSRGTLIRCLS